MILGSKILTALVWLAVFINWVTPLDNLHTLLHWTGIGLLAAHCIEAAVFLPKARQAGGSLPLHLLQLVAFGYAHAMQLDKTIADKKA